MARIFQSLAISLLLTGVSLAGAGEAETVPAGTPLVARIPDHLPLRVGQHVDAELMYPVYVEDRLVVPTSAHLEGSITALKPAGAHRLEARLRGDFTPFSTPVVTFDRLRLADGTSLPLQATPATDGAPLLRLTPPPAGKGGFVRRKIDEGMEMAKDRIRVVTGPDKRDRLVQYLYTQLPYHPQRVEKETAWTVETTGPLTVAAPVPSAGQEPPQAVQVDPDAPQTWTVEAYLGDSLSSATATPGQPIHAIVAEPIFYPDKSVAVPQGARIEGSVTQARPARRFGRPGVLRFDFRQITLPDGETKNVQASLAGVDSRNGALALDAEGKVKPKPQDKVIVPLILFALASSPLDNDGRGASSFGKNAVASNAFGLVGFVIGTTSQAPNVAAGIGYYGTALSLYNRWIKRGEETSFPRDTRLVVQTTARRTAVLRPIAR